MQEFVKVDSAVIKKPSIESATEVQADAPGPSSDDPSMTLTGILTVISNQRRRFVLHYLQRSGPAATTGELSTQIAAWELGQPAERVSPQSEKTFIMHSHRHIFAVSANMDLLTNSAA